MRRIRQRSKRQKIIAMLACGCSRGEIINTLNVSPEFVRKTIFDVRSVCAESKRNASRARAIGETPCVEAVNSQSRGEE